MDLDIKSHLYAAYKESFKESFIYKESFKSLIKSHLYTAGIVGCCYLTNL